MTSNPSDDPVSVRRTNKKRKVIKESIYLQPGEAAYTPAIRPVRRSTSARRTPAARPDEGDLAESSDMAAQRAAATERRRLGAMKAWETKRRKQRERFEALESGALSPLQLGERDRDQGPVSIGPFLAHLYVPDDTPKDVLLNAIHTYVSKRYTTSGLMIPPPNSATTANVSDHAMREEQVGRKSTPLGPDDNEDDPPSGSEYRVSNVDGAEQSVNDESMTGVKRKRGGQPGKRKLKDMYLALDGSALLALGTLVQELVVANLRDEGYVSANTLDRTDEGGPFQLSDSDDNPEDPVV